MKSIFKYVKYEVINWVYEGCCYNLFSILANVRNFGEGETKFNYISDSKGIPEDTDQVIKDELEWCSDHSETYITLRELLEFDWDQKISIEGTVNTREYMEFKKNGYPDCWCEWACGTDTKMVSNNEMDVIIKSNSPELLHKSNITYYTKVEWTETYRDSVGNFMESIETLKTLGDPDKVRIVMVFDS